MSGFQQKAITFIGAIVSVVFMLLPISVLTQPQTTVTQIDQTNRVSIAYIAAKDPVLQEFYSLLAQRHALEKIREILGPFRLPEELTIKTAECGVINSWYKRENFKPTVTVCYEYLRHILESLPNETTPAGVTPADAAVGQFFWVTFHEIGHAIFDIFDVPIFGHPEDAADNFAAYMLLQFGKGQAPRLIGGAVWAWRAYLGDYKRNPVVPKRITAFASDHGLPEERFYNLLCLSFGADPVQFAEANDYLPATRSPNCEFEYSTLVNAFHKEISPHIDQEMASRVLDTNWLPDPKWKPVLPQK
jgi:Putative metallopeptidase